MKPHLHFMGIGGVGMSGLARWYRADGYTVSGCDHAPSETTHLLTDEGVSVAIGHSPDHIQVAQPEIDTVISSMAVAATEPEWTSAQTRGLKTLKRIELLGELFLQRATIGITGTHGKSTTTGMTAAIFLHCGTDPSVLVGAQLPEIDGNVRYGKGEHLIAEVDESDPGFAQLKTHTGIITNLEDDHVAGDHAERRNYHASLADLEQATRQFASNAQQLIYCADWTQLNDLLGDLPGAHAYGVSPLADYRISEVTLNAGSSRFTLGLPTGESLTVDLAIPGNHNIQNATAALVAAHINGLDMTRAVAALASYQGVGRRWQRWGNGEALLIDDYAHHPTEVAATLATAQQTGRRVRAVLQPHRWVRTARHWRALADAASLADEILVLDIYSAGEKAIEGISPQLIVERLLVAGKRASYHTLDSAEDYLAASLEPNDLVITLGAGDVWRVAAGLAGRNPELSEA